MLKDAVTEAIAESLDEMDTFDMVSEVSDDFGLSPIAHMMSTMSEAETIDFLFPTELNSQLESMLSDY